MRWARRNRLPRGGITLSKGQMGGGVGKKGGTGGEEGGETRIRV